MCQKGYPNLCALPADGSGKPAIKTSGREIDQMSGLGTFGTETLGSTRRSCSLSIKTCRFAQAALIGCGVMTGVGAAINTAQVAPGSSVAVFGCGGVGLNCIQGAALSGAEPIIAVDVLDNKLELGRQFGATHTVNASKADPVEQIKEITDGRGVHYAFEAIGLIGETFRQAILCTRSRGVTVFVGHAPENTSLSNSTHEC